MDQARWDRINRIFDEVIELPAEGRAEYLHSECGDDDDLRQCVESLLQVAQDHRFVSLFAPEGDGAASDPAGDPMLGVQVGEYALIQRLGRGGSGTVYLGLRSSDFVQRAAIKILRIELIDDKVSVRRFERERQVLAHLQHANIAQLWDGGCTRDGRPYLITEYIPGEPIIAFSESNRLDLAGRIALFRQAMKGIAHAHELGVVHRDLKPGNILVRTDGIVKVVDFGTAKLLQACASLEGVEPETLTVEGWIPLTPPYASPEQMLGEPITTRTDIYSLGVVLYELVSGRRPFEFEELSVIERVRAISKGPPRISEANSEVPKDPVTSGTGNRPVSGHDGRALNADLVKQVGHVAAKALRLDPEERYRTIGDFDRDLEACVSGRTPSARLHLVGYGMRELCRSCWAYAATAILGIVAAFSILPPLFRPEPAGTAPSRDRDGVLDASEAFALYHLGEQDRVRDLVSKNQPIHGDRVEWRLLAQLVHHPDPVVLTTDYGIVQELVPIPHSDQFASATEGGVIEIWDLTTRQRVKMLEPVAEPLYSLAVSTDGKTIAAAGENLHLWDRESGQRLRRIKSYPHNVESLLFVNGDQELIVGLRYEFLELLRVGDGTTLRSVPFNNRFRMIVPVPAQDQLLVPAADEPAGGIGQSEKYIQLRTRDLSKELREFRHGGIEHMAISHDGRLLAASSRFIDDIVIFDFNSGEKLDVAKVTGGSHCRSLAFSLDDQYLISGHTDGTVKCWPLAASKSIDGKSAPRVFDESRVNTFQAGRRWVDSIFVTSSGDLVTNALDNQIKIWKLGGRPFASDSQKCDWLGVGSEILKAGLCDRFVSVMFDDGSVFVSHANSFSECDAILPAGNVRHSAGLSPDGNTLAVQRSGRPAYLIDISDPKNRKPVIGDSLQDSSDLWNSPFVWNVDGTKIAGRCADNLIKLWDVAGRRLLQSWQFEYDITDGVIFSPDGSTLAIGAINAPQLILLDLATGGTTQIRGGGDAGVLVWSPDGRYIANRTFGGKVYLVPVDTAAESDIRVLASVPWGPIAFTPDGSTLLLSASPGEIGLVDVETGRSLGYFHRSSDADVVYLGFSADGESILAVLGPRPSAPTRPGELLSWRLSLPSP